MLRKSEERKAMYRIARRGVAVLIATVVMSTNLGG